VAFVDLDEVAASIRAGDVKDNSLEAVNGPHSLLHVYFDEERGIAKQSEKILMSE
jgi:hypothetical protein